MQDSDAASLTHLLPSAGVGTDWSRDGVQGGLWALLLSFRGGDQGKDGLPWTAYRSLTLCWAQDGHGLIYSSFQPYEVRTVISPT